jgi:hypothetical protein
LEDCTIGPGSQSHTVDEAIHVLSESLIGEVFKALGLAEAGRARQLFGGLLRRATDRLSEIGLTFDGLCASHGFSAAAEWALGNWCRSIQARGAEHVPRDGPLLVISNHPGTYDALVIASRLRRDDLMIIASDIGFLRRLPHACQNFVFLDSCLQSRACAMRSGIRHLRRGGAVLLYGTGLIDPDPAISREAEAHIDHWSPSIDLFLRLVPQVRVVLSVVSHAVSLGWARSPITLLRRDAMDRRRVAEFGQVLQQLFLPGSLFLSPRLSLGPAIEPARLPLQSADGRSLEYLIAREKDLLHDHMSFFGAAGV